MSILANQDGMWKSKDIRNDHMTIEIMCTNFREIWIKCEGLIAKNVFYISGPPGGAIKGKYEKCGAKVFPWPLGNVHRKFYTNRWSYRQKHKSACYSATLRLIWNIWSGISLLAWWECAYTISWKLHTVFMIWDILFKMEQSYKLRKPILAIQDGIW